MLNEKEVVKKLRELALSFRQHVKNKQWKQAKACYEMARDVAVIVEVDRKDMEELFGERGEKGTTLKKGEFQEEEVQKVFEMVAVRKRETGK